MSWIHHNPVAIRFGPDALDGLARHLPAGRVLVLTTPGMVARGSIRRVIASLPAGCESEICAEVSPNPELLALEALGRRLAGSGFRSIVAFGGGSAIDSAKVLSVLLTAGPDYALRATLEGRAPLPAVAPLPVIAVPTTAGTGSEVTPFATVWHSAEGKKFSLAGPAIFPRAALLDPSLTHDLPAEPTLASGLDAFSQSLESIWNRHATPITLELARRGAALSFGALQRLAAHPPTPGDRCDLMEASLLAGLAISQTRTSLAHSMSYPITARFGLAHGLACSFMLADLLRFNAAADPEGRLVRLAQALGRPDVETMAADVARLLRALGVPTLVQRHVPRYASLEPLVPEMFTKGRSDNNLRDVDATAVLALLRDTQRTLDLA